MPYGVGYGARRAPSGDRSVNMVRGRNGGRRARGGGGLQAALERVMRQYGVQPAQARQASQSLGKRGVRSARGRGRGYDAPAREFDDEGFGRGRGPLRIGHRL